MPRWPTEHTCSNALKNIYLQLRLLELSSGRWPLLKAQTVVTVASGVLVEIILVLDMRLVEGGGRHDGCSYRLFCIKKKSVYVKSGRESDKVGTPRRHACFWLTFILNSSRGDVLLKLCLDTSRNAALLLVAMHNSGGDDKDPWACCCCC